MILKVLTYPDPQLRKKAKPVAAVTPELRKLAADMLETMHDASGIGLAATQVGEQVRLLVIDTRPVDEEGNVLVQEMSEMERVVPQPLVVFNPEILKAEGKTTYDEGCLSVPSFYETVERSLVVEVKYLDIEGKERRLKTDGLLAVCLQHEMDHLEGKLFIDRLSFVKSNKIKNRIKKQGYPTKEEAEQAREEARVARAAVKKKEFAV